MDYEDCLNHLGNLWMDCFCVLCGCFLIEPCISLRRDHYMLWMLAQRP